MQKIIIGIHGLGNKPGADLLESWWRQSIAEGLARIGLEQRDVPFELVFWADILHPALLNPEIEDTEDPLYLDEPYVAGQTSEGQTSVSFRAKLFGYFDRQLDSIFLNEDQSLNLQGVTQKIIHRYFSDLESYFRSDTVSLANPDFSVREHIQLRLFEVLKKCEGWDIMVIGHSMGSIVAYDVLFDHAHELNINTFVTIGSPLGLPFIMGRELAKQKLTNPGLQRPLVPGCIQSAWFNLSDIEDQVSMDHAMSDDFGVNTFGVTIEDFSIYNDYQMDEERNHHKSFGYLRTPEMARIVNQFLTKEAHVNWFGRAKNRVTSLLAKMKAGWLSFTREQLS